MCVGSMKGGGGKGGSALHASGGNIHFKSISRFLEGRADRHTHTLGKQIQVNNPLKLNALIGGRALNTSSEA